MYRRNYLGINRPNFWTKCRWSLEIREIEGHKVSVVVAEYRCRICYAIDINAKENFSHAVLCFQSTPNFTCKAFFSKKTKKNKKQQQIISTPRDQTNFKIPFLILPSVVRYNVLISSIKGRSQAFLEIKVVTLTGGQFKIP